MMKRRLVALALSGLVALGVAGCGDDTDDGDDSGTTTTTLIPTTTIPGVPTTTSG